MFSPSPNVQSAVPLAWAGSGEEHAGTPGTAVLRHVSPQNSCLLFFPHAHCLGSRSYNLSCSATGICAREGGQGREGFRSTLCSSPFLWGLGRLQNYWVSPSVSTQTSLCSCTWVSGHSSPRALAAGPRSTELQFTHISLSPITCKEERSWNSWSNLDQFLNDYS